MTETTVDSKGRIVIPEEIRKELKLGEGSKLRVSISESDNSIIIKSTGDPAEFIAFTKGFLKEGTPVQATDPLRLKEIWTSS
jgi:AbrB family looped-hinge helix DNA binding protein